MADLDRRCRIVIRAEGTRNDQGEFVEGPITSDENLWCQRRDLGSAEDILAGTGGTVVTAFATFTVRYREDLVTTRDGLITLYDEFGREHYIRRVREVIQRRKYLEIEAGFTSG